MVTIPVSLCVDYQTIRGHAPRQYVVDLPERTRHIDRDIAASKAYGCITALTFSVEVFVRSRGTQPFPCCFGQPASVFWLNSNDEEAILFCDMWSESFGQVNSLEQRVYQPDIWHYFPEVLVACRRPQGAYEFWHTPRRIALESYQVYHIAFFPSPVVVSKGGNFSPVEAFECVDFGVP